MEASVLIRTVSLSENPAGWVFEARAGETFLLGASTWRIEQITHDRVLVSPAPGEPGKMPFWKGEGPGRPIELGRAIGKLTRELAAATPAAAMTRLTERHGLTAGAATTLLQDLDDQPIAAGGLVLNITIVLGIVALVKILKTGDVVEPGGDQLELAPAG